MPKRKYARSKKRGSRKRSYRKRYRRKRLTARGVPSGMPTTRIAKLRYCDTFALTSTSGVLISRVFGCNNIFDPDVTGGGHQPMGHDTWATLYNHYTVIGSKMMISVAPSSGNNSPGMVGIYITDGAAVPYTSAAEFREARKGGMRSMDPNQKTVRMAAKFSPKKFFNITDMKDNTTRVGAAIGANPLEQAYYNIWYQTLDASSGGIYVNLTIDYLVVFGEPKDLSQS